MSQGTPPKKILAEYIGFLYILGGNCPLHVQVASHIAGRKKTHLNSCTQIILSNTEEKSQMRLSNTSVLLIAKTLITQNTYLIIYSDRRLYLRNEKSSIR